MARLFNAYVIVDWSAAESKATGKNSIWIGVLKRDVRFRFAFEGHNPPTRREAEALIAQILDDRAKHRERTLIGFDFALGYPRGFAEALKLSGDEPWRAVWDFLGKEVSDKADNMNNRFQVGAKLNRLLTGGPFPFWGSHAEIRPDDHPADQVTGSRPRRPAGVPARGTRPPPRARRRSGSSATPARSAARPWSASPRSSA